QETEVVVNSTTEAEYVTASSCCGQVLWIQNQLLNYGHILTTVGSKLMLLGITYCCWFKVNADKHILTNAGSKLMLLGISYYFWFKVNAARHTYYCWVNVNAVEVQETEVVVNSTTEAEYVTASSCCGQVLWIQNQLLNYGKPKRKVTQVPQLSVPTKSVADKAVYKELDDRLMRAATTASSLEAEYQEAMRDTIAQTRFENVSKQSNDSLLARGNILRNDEDRMKLNELMELCTNLQTKFINLEKTKTTQANEIDSLKKRVKKLEMRNKSRTYKLKRLYKVKLTARVESSDNKKSLGDDASKQERRIDDIDADEDITLVNVQYDTEMFDADKDLGGEKVFLEQEVVADKEKFNEVTLA
nr:ribonuclease H-like domain, reverse transcriptase, RNA-dependent DNA polymerase [Tanacetum cinerariifolium]